MNQKVKQVLKEHGINSINSEKFRFDNHENDNSIILDFKYILGNNDNHKHTIVTGYSEHPSVLERDDEIAVMFEDTLTNKEYWCHLPESCFWPCFIGEIFNIKELKEKID